MHNLSEKYFDIEAPLYQGRRFQHDCSEKTDRPLIVTRYPNGWKYYCHRCKIYGTRPITRLSPEQFKAWKKAIDRGVPENQVQEKLELPAGFTRIIPASGLAWLYRYGITDGDIEQFGIGYSSVLDRVVLPVYSSSGELLYWQGRNVGEVTPTNPKYVNVRAKRDDVRFVNMPWQTNEVVLVEDILSGIRVGHVVDCIGLLYAYIPDNLVWQLSLQGKRVFLFLDPDKNNYCLKKVQRYRGFGLDVLMIRVDQDPKYYTEDEIGGFIYGENG